MSRCLICRRFHAEGDCPAAAGSGNPPDLPARKLAPDTARSAQSAPHRPRWGLVRVHGAVCGGVTPIKRRPPQTWIALGGAATLMAAAWVGVTGSTDSLTTAALQAAGPLVPVALPILVIIVIGALVPGMIGRLFAVALTGAVLRLACLAIATSLTLLRLTVRELAGRRPGVTFDVRDLQLRTWQVHLLHDGAGLRFDAQVEVLGVALGGVVHAVVVKLPAKGQVALRPPLALCTLLTTCLVASAATAAVTVVTG